MKLHLLFHQTPYDSASKFSTLVDQYMLLRRHFCKDSIHTIKFHCCDLPLIPYSPTLLEIQVTCGDQDTAKKRKRRRIISDVFDSEGSDDDTPKTNSNAEAATDNPSNNVLGSCTQNGKDDDDDDREAVDDKSSIIGSQKADTETFGGNESVDVQSTSGEVVSNNSNSNDKDEEIEDIEKENVGSQKDDMETVGVNDSIINVQSLSGELVSSISNPNDEDEKLEDTEKENVHDIAVKGDSRDSEKVSRLEHSQKGMKIENEFSVLPKKSHDSLSAKLLSKFSNFYDNISYTDLLDSEIALSESQNSLRPGVEDEFPKIDDCILSREAIKEPFRDISACVDLLSVRNFSSSVNECIREMRRKQEEVTIDDSNCLRSNVSTLMTEEWSIPVGHSLPDVWTSSKTQEELSK